MNYEQAEADIVTRLSPLAGLNIEAIPLPENQEQFKRPFEKGKITVAYKGSKWEKPRSTSQITQEETLHFEIVMQSRTLRGSTGLYNIKQIVTQGLVGFQPTGCDRMYAVESGMTGVADTLQDGVWTYSAVFACTTLSVEDFEEDLSVLITRITNKRKDYITGELTGDEVITESAG
jgi:hypothetical protein